MRKASKILTLILIVVFMLSVFAGCDLVGKDVAKYRNTTAITVGNETINIGKLLDTFNSYYNSYYSYLSAGYITADYLLEMAISSLTQQYMQIDDYVSNHSAITPSLADRAHNAEYLTEDEFEYCVKYVKYLSFQSFDSNVESNITSKYDLDDPETEDTSRDFTEPDDLKDAKSYAEYLYKQNFVNEDANEYFEKYYSADFSFDTFTANDYVYQTEDDFAKARIAEFNDRRTEDEEGELTFEEYKGIQEKTLKQYKDTIENNYGISLEEFIANQVADMVSSCLLAKWSYEHYGDLETNDDNLKATIVSNFETLKKSQKAGFEINENFDSFITGLSSSSFIYDVPQDKQEQYVFVKNVLIPFSSAQTNRLTNLANRLGSRDRQEYKDKRLEYAAAVVADDFLSEKDDDGKYAKVEDIFALVEGKLVVNSTGALGEFLLADGSVKGDTLADKTATILDLMKQYNTDIGQHTARYDYVVYVGDDEDYSHNWVDEFVDAAVEANQLGAGSYALGISDYGVHIVYVVGYVEDQIFNFNFDERLDTTSASYRFFTSFFESQISLKTQEAFDALQDSYVENNKISVNKHFNKFLKENGFTFDIDEFLESLIEE